MRPTSHVQQTIKQHRRKTPNHNIPNAESRTADFATRSPARHQPFPLQHGPPRSRPPPPIIRIGQVRDLHHMDGVHLVRARHRLKLPIGTPRAHHRCHGKGRHGQRARRKLTQQPHPGVVDPALFPRLAQGCTRRRLPRLNAPARKTDLTSMFAQMGSPFGQ